MICSSLNRLSRTTPPPGPRRAILNGESHISTGLISGGQVIVGSFRSARLDDQLA